jgi:phosphoglycolate phosphatase
MKLEGVIFDLDGTLVNSLEDIADSMNSVLENMAFRRMDSRNTRPSSAGG